MFQCKIGSCGEGFDKVFEYTQHIQLHSNSAHFRYACGMPECRRGYAKLPALKAHMYRDHKAVTPCSRGDDEKDFACDLCAVTSSLVIHLRCEALGHLLNFHH